MPTALYRISSNEVVKISRKNQTFADRDATYWGVLVDPSLPDGDTVRDQSGEHPGPLRELGFAKIALPGSNLIRNATQPEIDTFPSLEGEDEKDEDAQEVKKWALENPRFRKLTALIFKAINQTREDAGLPRWTRAQIMTFIENQVSKDD